MLDTLPPPRHGVARVTAANTPTGSVPPWQSMGSPPAPLARADSTMVIKVVLHARTNPNRRGRRSLLSPQAASILWHGRYLDQVFPSQQLFSGD